MNKAWQDDRIQIVITEEIKEEYCWGLWPIDIYVVIDHFSRIVMAAVLLEGPNAG